MKKLFFILIVFSSVVLQAQVKLDSNKVPAVVRAKMWQLHPYANQIMWVYEDKTQPGYENKTAVEKSLCFEALLQDGDIGVVMLLDSTAKNYKDNGDLNTKRGPYNVPQKAIDKVNELVPGVKDAFDWEYALKSDSAKYEAFITLKDSSGLEYSCYFDSLWSYAGMEIEESVDTSLIPVHAVNNYIRKHYRHSEFSVANIRKDKNGNVTYVLVILYLKWARYNDRVLKFDGKGNLTGRPEKAIRRRMMIDF